MRLQRYFEILKSNSHRVSSNTLVVQPGIVVGLAIMGDSFLYGTLAIEASNLGIPIFLVGVLLSVNRIIRLLSNTWVAKPYALLGPRVPFLVSTILGVATTAIYGLGLGVGVFLAARIGWGIAWSGLRQGGFHAVWSGPLANKGKLMGILWGIIQLGSAVGVLFGGYLYDKGGFQSSIIALVVVGCIALPIALTIKWPVQIRVPSPEPIQNIFVAFKKVVVGRSQSFFMASAFIDAIFQSILISTISLFLLSHGTAADKPVSILGLGIGLSAGLFLSFRKFIYIFAGPIIGWISDRFGQSNTLMMISALSFLLLLIGVFGSNLLAIISMIIVFMLGAGIFVTFYATASELAVDSKGADLFAGVFNTAIDAGAAIGPLIGYALLESMRLGNLYILCGAAQLVAISLYSRTDRSPYDREGNDKLGDLMLNTLDDTREY